MFRPAARFLIGPRPPDLFEARFLAAVILPPLLFFAILKVLLDSADYIATRCIWMKADSSGLVWPWIIQLRGMDRPTQQALFLQDNPPLIFRQVSPQDSRYAAQNLLRDLLRSLERLDTHRQPHRDAPSPHTRRTHRRLLTPSEAIVILRDTGH